MTNSVNAEAREDFGTDEQIKDVRYIIVYLVSRTGLKTPISGLFVGYGPITHSGATQQLISYKDKFIWVFRGDTAHMAQPDYYDITSIGIGWGDKGDTYTRLLYNINQQPEALAVLKNVMKIMKETEKVVGNGLIDVPNVYHQIPLNIMEELELDSIDEDSPEEKLAKKTEKKAEKVKTVPKVDTPKADPTKNKALTTPNRRRTGIDHRTTTNHGTTTTNAYQITTSTFSRRGGEKPAEALTKMRKKLKEIIDDTYELPALQYIPADDEDVVKLELTAEEEAEIQDQIDQEELAHIHGAHMMY